MCLNVCVHVCVCVFVCVCVQCSARQTIRNQLVIGYRETYTKTTLTWTWGECCVMLLVRGRGRISYAFTKQNYTRGRDGQII
jgi:hypothetical protein